MKITAKRNNDIHKDDAYMTDNSQEDTEGLLSITVAEKHSVNVFKHVIIIIGNILLVLTAASCTVGAVISGFSFGVDFSLLFKMLVIIALVVTPAVSLFRGKGLALTLIPAIVLLYFYRSDIIDGAKAVIGFLTGEFSKWLVIPEVFAGSTANSHEITLFFVAMGGVLIFLLSIAICMRRSTLLTKIATLPFVILTFILIEFAPDLWFLFGLLAVYLTVLISSAAFQGDYFRRGLAVFPSLILALVLMGGAYLLAPPDSESGADYLAVIDSRLRNIAELSGVLRERNGTGWPTNDSVNWRFSTDSVSIADAGPRSIADVPLLEVTASHPGTFYLRGFSVQQFDGRRWYGGEKQNDRAVTVRISPVLSSSAEAVNPFWETMVFSATSDAWSFVPSQLKPAMIAESYNQLFPGEGVEYVSLDVTRTGDKSNIHYFPYYTSSYSYPNTRSDGYNTKFWYLNRSIFYYNLMLNAQSSVDLRELREIMLSSDSIMEQTLELHYDVDENTAEALRVLAHEAGIDDEGERSVVVDAVADFISSSARYSLSPQVTPDGEDFVLHFLQTSKQGYCIHFATAATLMLRALDIPARFTSGYVVSVPQNSVGETMIITDRNAHAWVEVYYDDVGWVPLEVTPPATNSDIPRRVPHTSTTIVPYSESTPESNQTGYEDDIMSGTVPTQTYGDNSGLTEDETEELPEEQRKPLTVIIVLIFVALSVAGLIVRQRILEKTREVAFSREDTNASAIYVWRYIRSLDKKGSPPEEIERIALKARFSTHTITESERSDMVEFARRLSDEKFRRKNVPGSLWLKYFRGL